MTDIAFQRMVFTVYLVLSFFILSKIKRSVRRGGVGRVGVGVRVGLGQSRGRVWAGQGRARQGKARQGRAWQGGQDRSSAQEKTLGSVRFGIHSSSCCTSRNAGPPVFPKKC